MDHEGPLDWAPMRSMENGVDYSPIHLKQLFPFPYEKEESLLDSLKKEQTGL
jgi:hypothetical protein